MRALFLAGRAIFWGFFVYNGINHLQQAQGMDQYAASKGVPAAHSGLATLVGFLVPDALPA